jgi:heme-degrading monooxygenase HmoA
MTIPGFSVLYRWRLKPGSEEAFVRAWSEVTEALLLRGSLGSRLHAGDDGLWYSYAQWPSAQARQAAFEAPPNHQDASKEMRDAILEELPEVVLTSVADYLK